MTDSTMQNQEIISNYNGSETKRMNHLKEIFSSLPDGKELLEFAERNNFSFSFNNQFDQEINGALDIANHKIELNPDIDDNFLLQTLAHELRHLWQASIIDFRTIRTFSVPETLVMMRIIEADAFTFSMDFSERLQKKTGITIPHHNCTKIGKLKELYTSLADSRKKEIRSEEPHAIEYEGYPNEPIEMKKTFSNFQKITFGAEYDRSILEELKSAHIAITSGKISKDGLITIFNDVTHPPPINKNIIKILRDGLSENSPSYLSFETVEELTNAVIADIEPEVMEKAKSLVNDIKKSTKQALHKYGINP